MHWSLIFVLTGLFAVGCSKSHQYANPCQAGVTYVETDTARYCVAVVVRGGFECPAELPYQLDIGEGAVCSAERIEVDDLPDVICIEFDACISSDGGMRKDATLEGDGQVETDGQVDVDLCSLPEVALSFEDIGSAGSGCPFGDPGTAHNGNATLIGASSQIAAGTTTLRVELDYCPTADDDCRCALVFDLGAERTSHASKIADSLQARVIDLSPVELHVNVSTPTVNVSTPTEGGAWSVTLLDSTALRETLVFAAARSRDLKEIVFGPVVFDGQLNVNWTGAELSCGAPVTHRVAEQVQVTFTGDQSTAEGPFGSIIEIDGTGGDRFSVWTTEASKTLDSGGNATGVATSAFFMPASLLVCNMPTPTGKQCANQNGLDQYRCSPDEMCFAPGQPNLGVCRVFDDCNTEAFACGEGFVCETYDDPSSCGGPGYRCVEDCRVVNVDCDVPTVCNEGNGLCEMPSCLEVDGLCDRFHECQPDGSCARVTCGTNEDCDCGYCVNGACYDAPGRCEPPAA